MYVYLFNYLFMVLSGMLLLNYGKNYKVQKKLFCVLASFQWILISGLRDISIGTDTEQYYRGHFLKRLLNEVSDIIPNLIDWFQGKDVEEPGFYALQILFQIFSDNYQIFLIFVACLFTIPLGNWIYKHSVDPLTSFAVYFALFSSFFAVTGMSQTVATAVVLFGGYNFLKSRKIFPFMVVCFIGILVHKSAVFFIILYFIGIVPISRIYFVLAFSAFGVIMLGKNFVMQIVAKFTGYTTFVTQTSGKPYAFTVVYILVCIVIAWRHKVILDKAKESALWINAVFMGLLCIPLVFVNASAMRGVQYYSVFLMLLIPMILETFRLKDRKLIQSIVLVLLGVLFFLRRPYYIFFWQ